MNLFFQWQKGNSGKRAKLPGHRRRTAVLQLEQLETRLAPVIGAAAQAYVVPLGTNLDGVVRVVNPNGNGSGAELFDTRHILTAAHVLALPGPGGAAPFAAHQDVFNLVRSDPGQAPDPVNITINVPAGAAFQQVPTAAPPAPGAPPVPANLRWNPATLAGDIGLDTITDQQPGMAAPNRQMVAPYIRSLPGGYQIYDGNGGNPVGQDFTVVGYGRSGTGNTGNMTDEVQQLTLNNVPAAGGQFTLTFFPPGGLPPLAATPPINTNAPNLRLAIAQALGARIGNTNVAVSTVGAGNNVFNIRFIGNLSGRHPGQMTAAVVAGGGGFAANVAAPAWNGGNTSGTKRAGMNTYDRLNPTNPNILQYDFDNGLAANNAIPGSSLGLGRNNPARLTDEAFAAQGDSGAPGLIWNAAANAMQIAGIVSYTDVPGATDVNNYINGNGRRVRVNSYGEIDNDTLVNAYTAAFITPVINARYDLVLDMNFQVLGAARDAAGNPLPQDPLTITASRGGPNNANLVLTVTDNNDPNNTLGLNGTYFTGLAANITSLTIRGNGGNDTFIIQQNLGLGPTGSGGITVTGRGAANTLKINDTADTIANVDYFVTNAVVLASQPDAFGGTSRLFRVDYAGINRGLEVDGGSSLNRWTVNSTPAFPTTLNTGTGTNFTTVLRTTGDLTINGQAGIDTVTVTNAGSVQGIRGRVNVTNTLGRTMLAIDDSADAIARNATLSATGVSGLAPAAINWVRPDLNQLIISGGSGGNSFIVQDTLIGGFTRLNSGSGRDTVDVRATSGHLEINGQAGRDTVMISSAGSVQSIRGSVFVTNAGGFTTLTIDDSADPTPRTVTLTESRLSGLAPEDISWVETGLRSLAINGGLGGNTFNVFGTPRNNLPVATTLSTGAGNDTVNVRDIGNPFHFGSPFNINGQAGDDRIRFFNFTGSATIDGGPGNNTIEVAQGTLSARQIPFTNVQNLEVTGGSTLVVNANVSIGTILVQQGTLELRGGVPTVSNRVDIQVEGILTGTGTINGSVFNGGQVRPGGDGAIGRITVRDDYTQGATGRLNLDLRGPQPGTQSDNLEVGHNVQLSGTLNLNALQGFNGDSFELVTNQGAAAVAGTFAGLAEGAIVVVDGRRYQVTYRGGDGNDVFLHLGPQVGTMTTVGSSLNPSVFGQAVTFTATVSPVLPGSGTPIGTVQFQVDGVNFGTPVTLTAGQATSAGLSTLAAGTHTITTLYSGQGDFAPSTGTLGQRVTPAPLTIGANNQSKVYGAAMPSLTASYSGFVNGDTAASLTTPPTLTTTATASSPVGSYAISASGAVGANYTISYVAGSLSVTPAALMITANNQSKVYGAVLPALTASYSGFVNGDTADRLTTAPTLTTTATLSSPVGSYPITARGAVDPNYAIGYVAGTLSVTPAATQVGLNVTPNPIVYGQLLTFNFSLVVIPPGSGSPSGTVTVRDTFQGATTVLFTEAVGATGPLVFPPLQVGTHVLAVTYNGDSNFLGSTSTPDTLVVNKASTTTTLTSSSPTIAFGQPLTISVNVAVAAPGGGTPTGTITIEDTFNGITTVLTSGTLGTTLPSFPPLAVGTHILKVIYSGDSNFLGSMSTPLTEVVTL